MRITLWIDCDSDAFQPAPTFEAARILREYAQNIEDMEGIEGPLYDNNGNKVGQVKLERD